MRSESRLDADQASVAVGELRVLQGLVEGAAPAEIAETYGIALSTVRTHLASLFRKTGSRRQPEVVRLAMGSVPAVRVT